MELRPFKSSLPSRWRDLGVEREFGALQREMNDVFDNFFGRTAITVPQVYDFKLYPVIDMQETDDGYSLEAELPGMSEKDIDIDLHNNILTICGEKKSETTKKEKNYTHMERYFGAFRRDIPFDEKINQDKVEASLKDGILKISVKKEEGGKKTHRKIAIKH